MEEDARISLRQTGNRVGGALLIYMFIMTASVAILIAFSVLLQMLEYLASYPGMTHIPNGIVDQIEPSATAFGNWGYLLAIAIGLTMLLLWKKPIYVRETILAPGRKMERKDFILLTIVFFSMQELYSWWYLLLEWAADGLGLSLSEIVDRALPGTDGVAMFLYACIFGPIAEEILFRGLILRLLQPYGRKFAIVISSMLFGLFHGNIFQVPFAFFTGLVMGYVALEYHIGWAMALHLINNLLLADLIPRVLSLLPQGMDDLILTVFLLACTVATVVILIIRRHDIREEWHREPSEKGTYSAFFRAPAIIVFLVISAINIVSLPLFLLFMK